MPKKRTLWLAALGAVLLIIIGALGVGVMAAGPGLMSRGFGWGCPWGFPGPDSNGDAAVTSLEEAEELATAYVARIGLRDVHVTEVMEFELNYYAIVAEENSGIGAMELLIDPASGRVSPEPGPNRMWNTRYGMHRGGMMGGRYSEGPMTVLAEEAEEIAQAWLDHNMPGATAGEADPFYGYYTLHFMRDGQVEGMLSVNGYSGDVWYHSWHGAFVLMSEHEAESRPAPWD
ncbi:MAG: hypothetical protein H5T69_12255 [Chloroflexi bacterium]|nr:hypothetical protein [Chloroflexota bacterium]